MKTASELGLTQKTFDALIAVRDKLVDGRFRHLTEEEFDALRKDRSLEGTFNMNIDLNDYKCGTVGCIGGWMGIEMGLANRLRSATDGHGNQIRATIGDLMGEEQENKFTAEFYTKTSNPLRHLFFPYTDINWDQFDTEDAAQAINNYLETGNAKTAWEFADEKYQGSYW